MLLIRHADRAQNKNGSSIDDLTETGEQQAAALGDALEALEVGVQQVHHSGAVRTKKTAEFAFQRYFSASVDGGDTFLPPVPVSTELSNPFGSGNLTFTPITFVTPKRSSRLSASVGVLGAADTVRKRWS